MEKKEEKSYGIIPLQKEGDQWKVFLVRHREGHWTFPKGHPDEGEKPMDCAARELFEETGLQINRLLPIPSLMEAYEFQRGETLVSKKNKYFLAVVEGEPVIQAEELLEGAWVPLNEAKEKATFSEGKRLCLQVEHALV